MTARAIAEIADIETGCVPVGGKDSERGRVQDEHRRLPAVRAVSETLFILTLE